MTFGGAYPQVEQEFLAIASPHSDLQTFHAENHRKYGNKYIYMPNMLIDPFRLKGVLINLLSNAVKFTEKGYVELSILVMNVVQSPPAAVLQFQVKDSGIGLTQEFQQKVFNRYAQGKNGNFGGSGLGLSLAQEIIHLMGGEITVDSPWNDGHSGACFSFTITAPLAETEDSDIDTFESAVEHVPGETSSVPTSLQMTDIEMGVSRSMVLDQKSLEESLLFEQKDEKDYLLPSDWSVLVVDDVPLNRKIIIRKLKAGGPFKDYSWTFDNAIHGEEALLMIREKEEKDGSFYDLIILDQSLSGSGGILMGYEVSEQIREWEKTLKDKDGGHIHRSIIVSSSGNNTKKDIEKYLAHGMDLCWEKPVPPTEKMFQELLVMHSRSEKTSYRY
jgi:CheY-like chemotaxis protein